MYVIPSLPLPIDVQTKPILQQLNKATRALAELKGVAHTIPNEEILINTLLLQEARDSSAIENIVTTQDELFVANLDSTNIAVTATSKEVLHYADAVKFGFECVKKQRFLTCNMIKEIQSKLVLNSAGFRNLPGTTLRTSHGTVVYTPPQDSIAIVEYMQNLEWYINTGEDGVDPLIKLAIVHHQFESIHPFYDGNGRTGRIINVLMLIINDLLELPILYLSRYIIANKAKYYELLQTVREKGEWEAWILFMLLAIEKTALDTIALVKGIVVLMQKYKIRSKEVLKKGYSHELINNLFSYPYTKIEFVMDRVEITRPTATNYLNALVEAGLLQKKKLGRTNYYLNGDLIELITKGSRDLSPQQIEQVETIYEK